MTRLPQFRLSGITIDCVDVDAVAAFWAALLELEPRVPLPGWLRIGGPGSPVPLISFQPVPEPKRDKARIHLDLDVADVEAAMASVVSFGGRSMDERHDYDEGIVVVMADPEGNEFCLVQHFLDPV